MPSRSLHSSLAIRSIQFVVPCIALVSAILARPSRSLPTCAEPRYTKSSASRDSREAASKIIAGAKIQVRNSVSGGKAPPARIHLPRVHAITSMRL
jgi:hypothetical protein